VIILDVVVLLTIFVEAHASSIIPSSKLSSALQQGCASTTSSVSFTFLSHLECQNLIQ